MKKTLLVIPVLALGLAACAQKSDGTQDSPVDQKYTDNTPAQIINFPDSFGNIAMKCDHHGNLVYSNTAHRMISVPSKQCPADWPIPR